MAHFPVPENEYDRISELHRLALLDTEPTPGFDAITAAATAMFGVPMSLVSLMDIDRQWFKSAAGFGQQTETPRDIAFCRYPVASGEYFEVADATADERFVSNPLVVGDPLIHFYAGAPIISRAGHALGTVCILDTAPRLLTTEERVLLANLAAVASALCEEHRARIEAVGTVERVLEAIGDAVLATNEDGVVMFMNPAACEITGWQSYEAIGRQASDVLRLVDANNHAVPCPIANCLASGEAGTVPSDTLLVTKDGATVPIEDSASVMVDGSLTRVGAAVIFRDVSEQRRLQAELTYLAAHDPLTGLFNRVEFENELSRALADAGKPGQSHALMCLDLDYFKAVNDQFGHAVGDELLVRVSRLLEAEVRPADTVARLGGDEFGIVLRDCTTEQARLIASRINGAIRGLGADLGDTPVHTAASIGIVVLTGECSTAMTAHGQADLACYAAKRRGGGTVEIYADAPVIDLQGDDNVLSVS